MNLFKIRALKKDICFLASALMFLFSAQAFAYEDCIVTAEAKLTGIQIQNNDIIDVFPLITVMNDKNTLIVHPLKQGKTKFSVIKNNNEKIIFEVKVTKSKTEISQSEGFDILTIDCPMSGFETLEIELDEPPVIFDNDSGLFELDNPPIIKERNR